MADQRYDGTCIRSVTFAGQTLWPAGCRSNKGRLDGGRVLLPPTAEFFLKQTLNQPLRSRTLLVEMTLPNESDGKLLEVKLQVVGPDSSFDHKIALGDPYDRCWSFCNSNGHPIQLLEEETGWVERKVMRLVLDANQKTVSLQQGAQVLGSTCAIDRVWSIPVGSTIQIGICNHSQETIAIHRVGLWSSIWAGDIGSDNPGPGSAVQSAVQPASQGPINEPRPPVDTSARVQPPDPQGISDVEIPRWKDGRWAFDVFISHAGEDKRFAFRLQEEFKRVGLRAFVDQADLFGGDSADDVMLTACREAPVGLALLSADSLRKEWPVEELKLIVAESTLLPVLYNMSYEDAKKALETSPQAGGVGPDQWREFVRTVTRTTAEKNPSTGSDELPFVQLIVFAAVRLCVKLSPLVEKHSSNPAFALAFVQRLEKASFAISKEFKKIAQEKADLAKQWHWRMHFRAEELENR